MCKRDKQNFKFSSQPSTQASSSTPRIGLRAEFAAKEPKEHCKAEKRRQTLQKEEGEEREVTLRQESNDQMISNYEKLADIGKGKHRDSLL